MPDAADIKRRIEAAIPGAKVEVEDWTGGGDHFKATVTAAAFSGLSRIEQHRLVYDVFGEEIGGPIHALSLKTESTAGQTATGQTSAQDSPAAGPTGVAAGNEG